MEGTAWDARRAPPARVAARTASAARPDPCCRLGGGHGGGAHGVALAITEGHQAESKLVSMGPVAGEWPGASDPPLV